MRCKRKGASTILGVLIFIGILFTAVIPMQLVMNQADMYYDRKIKGMEASDKERARSVFNHFYLSVGYYG